jgi:hypothetical protein
LSEYYNLGVRFEGFGISEMPQGFYPLPFVSIVSASSPDYQTTICVLKIDIAPLAFRRRMRNMETSARRVPLQRNPEATDMWLLLRGLTLQIACISGKQTGEGYMRID